MSVEQWLDVKGYGGAYLVSNKGRVKSLARKVGSGKRSRKTKDRILVGNDNGNGYLYVDLSYKGVQVREYVHRLVATYFIENIRDAPEVNHKNAVKHDNRLENLEWVTRKENIDHAILNGLTSGVPSELSILKLNMIIDLLLTEKYSIQEIKTIFKVSTAVVREVRELDKGLVNVLNENKRGRRNRGKKVVIYDKKSGRTTTFDSAKEGAERYGLYDGYFAEVVTKYGGENARFKVAYKEVD